MDQRGMVLLAGNSHPALAAQIASHLGITVGDSLVYYNGSKEIQVEIQESVRGKDVYIIQTGAKDVNNAIMELLIMAYACKTSSCKNIIGVVPYLPYCQQTKMKRRGNISLKLVADLCCKAGFSHIITLDLHSKESQAFFSCRMDNLRASPFFLQYIIDNVPDYNNSVIVAKNPIAARRATSYADRLRLGIAVIHGEMKQEEIDQDGRASPPPSSPAPPDISRRLYSLGAMLPPQAAKEKPPIYVVGEVSGKTAIIVDDIMDDVQSFVDAAKVLKEAGANKVFIMATHGILSGQNDIRLLENSQIDEVVLTNSVPPDSGPTCNKFKTVDISILLAEAIRRIHNKESMSHLFKNVTMED